MHSDLASPAAGFQHGQILRATRQAMRREWCSTLDPLCLLSLLPLPPGSSPALKNTVTQLLITLEYLYRIQEL